MTFKHKLSSRLARLWTRRARVAAVVAAAAILGCLRPLPTDAGNLARLVILPPLVSLAVNQSTDFVVFGVTDNNDTVAVAVTWSATGGDIKDTTIGNGLHKGRFRAGNQTGRYAIAATEPQSGKVGSATADVTSTPAPIASVLIIPASASAVVGDAVQFVALPLDAGGTALGGRVISWSSSNTSVASVDVDGLAQASAAGSTTITATSEGVSGTATLSVTTQAVPVASVTVTPGSASATVGGTVQFAAVARDASGTALSGRVISWSSSNTSVASVSSSGLARALVAGSANITATSEGIAGAATFTVLAAPPPPPPPPPPPGGTCLNQTGPSLTVSGLSTSGWSNTSLASNTKVDARTAQWLMGPSQLGTYVMIGGGTGLCWSGGEVMAQDPPDFPYSGNYHDIYGMNVHAANATVENVRVFTGGDGITFDEQGSANWTVRGMYIRYMRDDCIENDFLNSGLIDDVLAEGCYTFLSSRTYTGSPDGTNNTVTVQNSLVWLEQMDAIYPSLTAPGSGGFFKWVGSGTPNTSNGPSLVINNTVFRADAVPVEGDGAGEYFAPPKLKSCSNNVMVWLGTGSLPASLPSCFTVMTGSAGLDYWNSRVAAWKAAHPAGADFTPPIVALWAVPSTLSGTVTLQATAVDDQTMAGVQFLLNGQPIGSEVLPNQVDKARLSWDSRTKPNGSYTLTATARDAAGHTKTSAGIAVTISN